MDVFNSVVVFPSEAEERFSLYPSSIFWYDLLSQLYLKLNALFSASIAVLYIILDLRLPSLVVAFSLHRSLILNHFMAF